MSERKPHRFFELQEYNPEWPKRFAEYKQMLEEVFGDECVAVEHIGSTSIPNMTAKPQIDMLLIVKNIDHVAQYQEALSKEGFAYKGREYVPRLVDHDYFVKDDADGKRLVSIHVVPDKHPEIHVWLSFRDYLRSHEEERELYLKTKRSLYQEYKDDYHSYDSGKAAVVQEIYGRASEWYKNK